ncbi:MAG: hypothetical protein C0483_13705 [Pirellula sp.]|nr:hypothetical protein [Pirellula sp.]
MSKTKQEEKLEAAGWQCGGSHSVEVTLDGDEVRYFMKWAEKGQNTVRVVGKPTEVDRVWERVYLEAKQLDPTGLD